MAHLDINTNDDSSRARASNSRRLDAFASALGQHAAARSSMDYAAGPVAEKASAAAWSAAERSLVRARARKPLDIAYKLHAAWIGADPDHPELNEPALQAILADPEVSNDRKLIASAFLDLCLLAAEDRGETPPRPGARAH